MAKASLTVGPVPTGSLKSPLQVNKRRGQKTQTVKPNPKQGGLPSPISK